MPREAERGPPAEPRLDGLGVVVTRPAGQAEPLVRRLAQAGARVLRLPALEIAPPAGPGAAAAAIASLEAGDLALFVSANAVEYGLAPVRRGAPFPAGLRIGAIGPATAAALERAGLRVHLLPRRRHDSEGLLALPALQREAVAGRRVVIFRGEGGRTLLAERLGQRGARVDSAIVYRRLAPAWPPEALLEPLRRGEVDAVLVSSGEGLRNLLQRAGAAGREALAGQRFVVPSARVAALARSLGIRQCPLVAGGAGDDALLEALGRLSRGTGQGRAERGP